MRQEPRAYCFLCLLPFLTKDHEPVVVLHQARHDRVREEQLWHGAKSMRQCCRNTMGGCRVFEVKTSNSRFLISLEVAKNATLRHKFPNLRKKHETSSTKLHTRYDSVTTVAFIDSMYSMYSKYSTVHSLLNNPHMT